jgi:uncharacterized protein (TIGR02466 family)
MYSPGTPKNLFPIKIYEAAFEGFEVIQQSLIDASLPYFDNPAGGNEYFDGQGNPMIIRTNNDLHKDPAFKDVVNFIEFHGREYWKACNYTERVDPYVIHMWANKLPPGGFTPPHNHNPTVIAGAFYLDADPIKGDLYLEDPLNLIHGKMPYDFLHKPYLYTETIKVESGKLVMFPGWMYHHTRSNMSNSNRYVLGFNFGAWINFLPKS